MFKKILLVLLIALIIIQFIHPTKNQSTGAQPNNITTRYAVPANVKTILDKACMDCHSNNTSYPWYAKIQPVHWWMQHHVDEGKHGLNFDEYVNRSLRYQYHKMEEINEQVKEGEMPLASYTWIHKNAILTSEEKLALANWTTAVQDSMEAHYPMDSLIRKKKS